MDASSEPRSGYADATSRDRNARPITLATFTLRRGPSGWASIRLSTRLCRLGGSSSASGSTEPSARAEWAST